MKSAEKKTTDKMQINETQMWNFIYLMQLPLGMGPGEAKIHDVDWELMYRLARKQNVVALGYEAARSYTGTSKPSQELMKKWKALSDQSTMQYLYQQAAQEELAEAFDRAKIPFIFLKGALLRDLYPRPDLRSMSDIDVMIHEENAREIQDIMKQLGYTVKQYDWRNEDIYYKDPCVTVEIHRKPFWREDGWNQYLEKGWDNPSVKNVGIWDRTLNLEDFYFYLMGHLLHHLRECGGAGIKIYLDMELFLHNFGDQMNSQKMAHTLKQFGFVKFEKNLNNLVNAWKHGELHEDIVKNWTEYIVESGAYRNVDSFIILNPAFNNDISQEEKGYKLLYFWKRLFPAYREICYIYPMAKKGIYTYPYYWIKRIIKNGIMRYSEIRNELNEVCHLNQEKISRIKKLYQDIGIPQRK